MKDVKNVYDSIWFQQNMLLKEIYEVVYSSGNMKGAFHNGEIGNDYINLWKNLV